MADGFPETLFEQIYKRTPSEADRDRLIGVKAALNLSERDELWPILLTLDYYSAVNQNAKRKVLKALDDLPRTVKSTVNHVEVGATAKADAAIAKAIDRGIERLAEAATERSKSTQDRISKRQFVTAASIGALVALFCLAAGAGAGYVVTENLAGICTTETFSTSGGRVGCYVD